MKPSKRSPFRSLALFLYSCLLLCWISPFVNCLAEEDEETNFARDMLRRNIYPRDTREFDRYQNDSTSNRIVGGCNTGDGYEYQCYFIIEIKKTGTNEYYILFCGCVWIDCYGTAVTAAHCCDKDLLTSEGYEWAGATPGIAMLYSGKTSPVFGGVPPTTTVNLETGAKIYPAWDSNTLQNDICLLFRICEWSGPTITPIRLAEPPMDPDHDCNGCTKHDTKAIVSGIGISTPGWTIPVIDLPITNPVIPNELQCVSNTICSTAVCNAAFLGVPCPTVTHDMICMSGFKFGHPFLVGSCNGDSGGPFIICLRGEAILIGIVSFGFGPTNCYLYPSVFTRISSYSCWIYKMIKEYQTCADPITVPCNYAGCPTCGC